MRNITLSILKQPGSNVVAVVDEIKKLLPAIQAQLPPSVSLDVRTDRSMPIRESVHDVKLTLLAHDRARHRGHLRLPAKRHRPRSSPA